MVSNNFIDTIIQLPENLFFGPTIATCILVLKKSKNDNSILFVDASEEYIKTGKKNKLSKENIDNIVNIVKDRKSVDGKAILVENDIVLKEENTNLFVNTYLKNKGTITEINIKDVNFKLKIIKEERDKIETELNKIIESLVSKYE